jgi:zinc protease
MIKEIGRLTTQPIASTELDPRKLVLTGIFGQDLETTAGLAATIGNLYAFGLRPAEMNVYISGVRGVSDQQIRSFAGKSLLAGDVVIVGDSKLFMDDLKKRFPNMMINVINADELDLSKESLRK